MWNQSKRNVVIQESLLRTSSFQKQNSIFNAAQIYTNQTRGLDVASKIELGSLWILLYGLIKSWDFPSAQNTARPDFYTNISSLGGENYEYGMGVYKSGSINFLSFTKSALASVRVIKKVSARNEVNM